MSLLAKATAGVTLKSTITVIQGESGTGKSTLASQYPKPIFFDIEDGTKGLPVKRLSSIDIPDFETLMNEMKSFVTDQGGFKTLVLDSVTALEKYAEISVCKKEGVALIKDIPFGGGPVAVRAKFQEFMDVCKDIRDKAHCDVVIISHTQVKAHTDPHLNATYDRNVLQCNEKVAHIIVSTADNVFFLKNDVEVKSEKGKPKAKAFGDGSKVIYTDWRPGFVAKNRLGLPFELPAEYSKLVEAIENAKGGTSEEIIAEIKELLKKAPDETKAAVEGALAKPNLDEAGLRRIKAKLITVVSA